MPSTIGKCKLFRIKHITLLEGEIFLRNKHDIAFFAIKCTFFGRKENTINNFLVRNLLPSYLFLILQSNCITQSNADEFYMWPQTIFSVVVIIGFELLHSDEVWKNVDNFVWLDNISCSCRSKTLRFSFVFIVLLKVWKCFSCFVFIFSNKIVYWSP